jgi:hypothetical protein
LGLTPFEFVVAVLAATRATVCVVSDSILDAPRDAYRTWAINGGRVRQKLDDLATCPHCAGFWLSAVTYLVMVLVLGRWHDVPILAHLWSIWAVAGAQLLLNGFVGASEAAQEEDDDDDATHA